MREIFAKIKMGRQGEAASLSRHHYASHRRVLSHNGLVLQRSIVGKINLCRDDESVCVLYGVGIQGVFEEVRAGNGVPIGFIIGECQQIGVPLADLTAPVADGGELVNVERNGDLADGFGDVVHLVGEFQPGLKLARRDACERVNAEGDGREHVHAGTVELRSGARAGTGGEEEQGQRDENALCFHVSQYSEGNYELRMWKWKLGARNQELEARRGGKS